MKPLSKLLFISIAFIGATAAGNAALLLTLDDLPSGGPLDVYPPVVPNGYGGLDWGNFAVEDGLKFGAITGDGYYYGVVSSPNVAFNEYGNPASIAISSGSFDLDFAYLTSALISVPTQNIQVQGFVGATMLYNNSYTVINGGPTLINFDYIGIESVTFTSGGQQFVMDNLTVTVPEPSTIRMLIFGAAGVGLVSIRKRFRKESEAA